MKISDVLEFVALTFNPLAASSGFLKIFAKTDGKLYKITSAGTVTELGQKGDTGPTGATGANATGVSTVVLGTRRTSITTTLADVTGLSFAVTNGKNYAGFFLVIVQTTATGTGILISLSGPTASNIAFSAIIPTQTTADSVSNRSAWNTGSATTGMNPANTNFLVRVDFQFKATADGTLVVRFASETTSQVSVEVGSSGVIFDMGT